MHKFILILVDTFFLLVAYLTAYYLRNSFEPQIQNIEIYLDVFHYILIIFLLIFASSGLYNKKIRQKPFTEIYKIIKAVTLLVLILMAASFLQKFDYSRAVLILFWLFAMIFLMIDRLILKKTDLSTSHIQGQLKGEALPELEAKEGGAFYEIVKRVFDSTFSLASLIIFLPIWIFITITIKLDSKGPAIIKHQRVGKNGKKFWLYKFRTMDQFTDPQALAPTGPHDKRVTKFGRLLRKTSLDEAPQFINVLKGEMSVIGPRPEMPFIAEQYDQWQKQRLEVRPGITGLWQVLGRKDIPLKDNLEYDFYYIKHRSLLLDIVILIRTVAIVLTGKGAY